MKFTAPVGAAVLGLPLPVPLPLAAFLTASMKVTLCPKVLGFKDEVTVAEVCAGLIVNVLPVNWIL